jgi:hypothetical protein
MRASLLSMTCRVQARIWTSWIHSKMKERPFSKLCLTDCIQYINNERSLGSADMSLHCFLNILALTAMNAATWMVWFSRYYDWLQDQSSFPGKYRDISLRHQVQTGPKAHPVSRSVVTESRVAEAWSCLLFCIHWFIISLFIVFSIT